jgi:membrane protein CcdC involved in cytochrome C biogenesis
MSNNNIMVAQTCEVGAILQPNFGGSSYLFAYFQAIIRKTNEAVQIEALQITTLWSVFIHDTVKIQIRSNTVS